MLYLRFDTLLLSLTLYMAIFHQTDSDLVDQIDLGIIWDNSDDWASLIAILNTEQTQELQRGEF